MSIKEGHKKLAERREDGLVNKGSPKKLKGKLRVYRSQDARDENAI